MANAEGYRGRCHAEQNHAATCEKPILASHERTRSAHAEKPCRRKSRAGSDASHPGPEKVGEERDYGANSE